MRPLHGTYCPLLAGKKGIKKECYILKFLFDVSMEEAIAVAVFPTGELISGFVAEFTITDPSFHFSKNKEKPPLTFANVLTR